MKKIFLILLICLSGCATGFKKDQYIPKNVLLNDAKIIVNGKTFAELIFIAKRDSDWGRGIAIHYLATDRYEWISPREGWKLKNNDEIVQDIHQLSEIWDKEPYRRYEKIKGSKTVCCDGYQKLEWRGSVKLSDDYKFILFQEASLFGPKDRKYRMRY